MAAADGSKYVRLRYWNMMRNCGDAISSYILKRCFAVEPRFVEGDTPHLCAVGSIIGMSNRHSHIWGSGMLGPKWNVPAIPAEQFHAVRGRKTLQLLRDKGIAVGDIPLGDPGIFVDEVMSASTRAAQPARYRAAIVPHHSALKQREYQVYAEADDVCIVNMIDDTLLPIEQIMQSDVVISHSLHGLIFAEALGKPSVWIAHTADPEWCFKFEDWYSTNAEPQATPLPLTTPLDDLIRAARRSHHTIDKAALRAVFPGQMIEEKPQEFISFEECRARKFAVVDLPNDAIMSPSRAAALDDKSRADFQWRITKRFKDRFNDWSEPAYACLRPHRASFTPRDIEAATDFLDQNLKYEFALLADPGKPATYDRIFEANGTTYGVTEQGQRDGAIVLRPHGWFSPASPHVQLTPLAG